MSRLVMLSSFVCSQLRFLLGLIASLSLLLSSFLGKFKVRVNGPSTAKDAPPLTNSDSVLTEDSVRVRFITPQPFGEVLRLEGGEGPTHFFEFRRSLEDAWFDRGWSEEAKVRCIWRHLGPDPREELDCQTNGRPTTPDDAFRLLDRRFGDNRDPCQVFVDLFNISQNPEETITRYSHHLHQCYRALLRLEEKRGDPYTICPDYHLRSMFIRGITSLDLRRVLRHLLRRYPDTTFDQLRDEALSWEKSETPVSDRTAIDQGVEPITSTPETVASVFPPVIIPCQLDQLEADAPASLVPAKRRRRRRRRTLATTQLAPPVVTQEHPAVFRIRRRQQRLPRQPLVGTVDPVVARAATLREIRAISLVESPAHRQAVVHLAASPLPALCLPADRVASLTATLPGVTVFPRDDVVGEDAPSPDTQQHQEPEAATVSPRDTLPSSTDPAVSNQPMDLAVIDTFVEEIEGLLREYSERPHCPDRPPPYEACQTETKVPALSRRGPDAWCAQTQAHQSAPQKTALKQLISFFETSGSEFDCTLSA